MQPDFTLPSQAVYARSPVLPTGYRGFVLRGSTALTAVSAIDGSIIVQALEQQHYGIRFTVFDFLKPVSLAGIQPSAMLVSVLAIRSNIRYFIKGVGTLHLKQGEFALLHTTEQLITAQFSKPNVYEVMEVSWSADIIKQAVPSFNMLLPLFTPGASGQSYILPSRARHAGVRALDIATDILTAPYDDELGRLFFENKVREYLLELLVAAGRQQAPAISLTVVERDKLIAIGEQIRSQPNKKFPIAALSIEAGMNSMKLKEAFKEIHGQGIFEHHMTARMEEARRLLIETDLSTKQISARVGYKLPTSFITRFKKYFGYYTSAVQRNSK